MSKQPKFIELEYYLSFNKKKSPKQKQILELFGAKKFIISKNQNYNKIEKIGRKIGKIK